MQFPRLHGRDDDQIEVRNFRFPREMTRHGRADNRPRGGRFARNAAREAEQTLDRMQSQIDRLGEDAAAIAAETLPIEDYWWLSPGGGDDDGPSAA